MDIVDIIIAIVVIAAIAGLGWLAMRNSSKNGDAGVDHVDRSSSFDSDSSSGDD